MNVRMIAILSALLRIAMGWIFLWAFADKLFGLGFETARDHAWIVGNSPTRGFLAFGVRGPLASSFTAMAGNPLVDWLFMLGLAGVGCALILGIGMRIASASGALLMILIYSAAMPPVHNPLIDEHIIYILVLLLLPAVAAQESFGFGKRWAASPLVRRFPLLR